MADGKVRIEIEADDSDFKKTVDDLGDEAKDAADGVEDLGDAAKDAGKNLEAADVAAGTLVANGLTALIGAIQDAIGYILDLADSTREYREDMARLDAAFTVAGHSTEAAGRLYEDFYAILGESDRSVEAANHIAELTDNEEDFAKWSVIAAGVAAKFGDSLPIEGLTEAANETAKVGKVTGPLADALNWAGISEDEFNEKLAACSTEQERAALITNTLNGLYSEAAAEYNELTKDTQAARRATAKMEETQAELGAAMEPVMTAWTEFKVKALQAIVPIIQNVATKIQELSKWLEEHKTAALIIKAVVIALAAAFGVFATALGISALITMVTKAIAILNATLLANPITLIVAAVAALVAAFIYLWNNCEGFREFWINLWETIKGAFTTAWEAVVTFFTVTIPETFNNFVAWLVGIGDSIKQFFVDMWNSIVAFFTEGIPAFLESVKEWFADLPYKLGYLVGQLFGHIVQFGIDLWKFATETIPEFIAKVIEWFATLPEKIWTWLKNAIDKVTEWGKKIISTGKQKAEEFVNKVIDFIKGLPEKIWTWLTNTVDKVVEWGGNLATKGLEAAKELVTSVIDGVKELPAKMLEVGKNIVDGVWQGIKNAKDQFFANVKGFFSGLVDGAKDALGIASPSKEFRYVGEMSADGYKVGWEDNLATAEKTMKQDLDGLTARVQASVSANNGRMGQSMGRQETGFADLARAVGIQTAGINSLSAQYRSGAANMRPIVLELNGRELGRAVVNVSGAEGSRVGLALGGAY